MFLLPHEQELLDSGRASLQELVVQYRTLFLTCWDVMTAEQQHEVTAVTELLREHSQKDKADG